MFHGELIYTHQIVFRENCLFQLHPVFHFHSNLVDLYFLLFPVLPRWRLEKIEWSILTWRPWDKYLGYIHACLHPGTYLQVWSAMDAKSCTTKILQQTDSNYNAKSTLQDWWFQVGKCELVIALLELVGLPDTFAYTRWSFKQRSTNSLQSIPETRVTNVSLKSWMQWVKSQYRGLDIVISS